jgi:hypothetical protein
VRSSGGIKMEASIKQKRDAMEMCHKLIPMMDINEIHLIGLALEQTINRLVKEGRVTDE